MKLSALSSLFLYVALVKGNAGQEIPWCFSQVKGTIEEEIAEGLCFAPL